MAQHPIRRSLRLREFNYGQPGNYFFTICTFERACFLSVVRECEVHLSTIGELVNTAWLAIPDHHPAVLLDEMVIMPNHVHGILCIQSDENGMPIDRGIPAPTVTQSSETPARRSAGPGKGTLGAIIGSFKSSSSRNINRHRGTAAAPVWQRNYYEHIIRNERSLDRIRTYIAGNPARWDDDDEN